MADFDTTKDYQIAGAILFPMALVGLGCNLSVVAFLNSMPSLKNSFGIITLSQAIVDCIHQLLFAAYFAPTIFFQNSEMYAISDLLGFTILTAYQICCYSHVSISANRFVAVCAPLFYARIFRKSTTLKMVIACWTLGICHMTFMLKYVDCALYLPEGTWIFTFKDTPSCHNVKWYGDFLLNSISVVIVAIMDTTSILRLHCYSVHHTDEVSIQRRKTQKNLTYQAALQGVLFISELLTYFLLSGYARNKWEAFVLTSVSWCLVNGMDGFDLLLIPYSRVPEVSNWYDSRSRDSDLLMRFETGYAIFCGITTSLSYLLAGILVVVAHKRRDRVGFYRYFTYAFVLVDVLYSSALLSLSQIVENHFWLTGPSVLAFFSIAPWNSNFTLIQISYQVWFAFFAAILLCITCSFVYRYGILCSPLVVSIFERPRRFIGLCSLLLVVYAFWLYDCNYLMFDDTNNIRALVQERFGDEFQSDFMTGYMLTVDLNNNNTSLRSTSGAVILMLIVQAQLVIMVICGWKIHITVKMKAMSEKLKRLHRRALNMLIAQTLNPLCFLFIPTFFNILGMFTEINTGAASIFIVFSFTLFPIFNPIIVICFTEDYKRYVFGQPSHVSDHTPAHPTSNARSAVHSSGSHHSQVSAIVVRPQSTE